MVILGQVHVQLNAKAVLHGILEGRQAVFRQLIIPQPTMGIIVSLQVVNLPPWKIRQHQKKIQHKKNHQYQ